MTFSRPRAFFLALAFAGSLLGQAARNNERTLTTEGVAFKLPAGWEWQSEIASNIAIKKELKARDQVYTITADLVYSAEGFLEDTIAGIEKKVAASKGDLRDLKVNRGERFAASPAVLVSFSRVRGEKGEDIEDERQYLLRRSGALYVWTERANRAVSTAASSAFSAARNAVTFTGKDKGPKTAWPEAGVKFTPPPDFDIKKVAELPKVDDAIIMTALTTVTIKGQTRVIAGSLRARNSPALTLDRVEAQAKEIYTGFEDTKDFEVEKTSFRGEKAVMLTFTAAPKAKHEGQKPPRIRFRAFVVKKKPYVIYWEEETPEAADPAIDAALKKARDGVTFQAQ
jgi:hypothetical protein